jgi:hypothetical protein
MGRYRCNYMGYTKGDNDESVEDTICNGKET